MSESEEMGEQKTERIRAVIENFLQERLQPELEKIDKKIQKTSKNDEEELKKLNAERKKKLNKFNYHNWLTNAARKSAWLKQSTHPIKYSHPDAKGTCPNVPGNAEAGKLTVGTHTVSAIYLPDIAVKDAKALNIIEFLYLDIDGVSLLDLAAIGHPSLTSALMDNSKQAKSIVDNFAKIISDKDEPKSDVFIKQLYWPLDNDNYHLLAPMFPSSLVQIVQSKIDEDRFSDEAKAAREAKKLGASHDNGYREYPLTVIQKFGGDHPKNISQFNRARKGKYYLLASCPPEWISEPVRPPLKVNSIFSGWFGRRKSVQDLTKILKNFLLSVRDVNNSRIRTKRAELVDYIRDELIQFAAEIQELPGGWSQDKDCRLNQDEQCWLDPDRAKTDESFAALRLHGAWRNAVSLRFGNWLNAQLTSPDLPMGENEAQEWSSILNKELRMYHLEMDRNE